MFWLRMSTGQHVSIETKSDLLDTEVIPFDYNHGGRDQLDVLDGLSTRDILRTSLKETIAVESFDHILLINVSGGSIDELVLCEVLNQWVVHRTNSQRIVNYFLQLLSICGSRELFIGYDADNIDFFVEIQHF